MAKRTSAAEDLLAIIAMMPWWAGVSFAVVSYFTLHHFAGVRIVGASANALPGVLIGVVVSVFCSIGQYLLPLIGLLGAIISLHKRQQRRTLFDSVANANDTTALDGMSWREFEMLTGEAFRQQGYAVIETGGNGPDGGIDLVLNKAGQKFYVQCKQWKTAKVRIQAVRELFGVMAAAGAAGGFVVTSGSFTRDATAFAQGKQLHLIGGAELFAMIRRARQTLALPASRPLLRPVPTPAAPPAAAPTCPLCSAEMVQRVARKGTCPGARFLGCTNYPLCKGTRAMIETA